MVIFGSVFFLIILPGHDTSVLNCIGPDGGGGGELGTTPFSAHMNRNISIRPNDSFGLTTNSAFRGIFTGERCKNANTYASHSL